MQDNQLIRLFLGIIQAGLVAYGLPDVAVKQAYQPTAQGANSGPTVYFYTEGDEQKSAPLVIESLAQDQKMYRTIKYLWWSTFRVETLVRQNPANVDYTAKDLARIVAQILQEPEAIEIMVAAGTNFLRIENVQNQCIVDDREQHESMPFFTFTITHNTTIVREVGVIKSVIGEIFRV